MTTSTSRQSYEDCYDLMDNALAAGMGVRLEFDSEGDAKHQRTRMNHARALDRDFNGSRYTGADPRRNKSDYDTLTFRVRFAEGKYWLYIEKRKAPLRIEEIREGEGADNIATRRPVFRRT